jgi:hypothetical protein
VTLSGAAPLPYQYVTLRWVPRVDRGELLNVGVVVYCQGADYLEVGCQVDEARLRALDPAADVESVREALRGVTAACHGTAESETAAVALGTRFGHVSAPRSTVLQPGPVHSGVTTPDLSDGPAVLGHLLRVLVAPPEPNGGRTRGQH